MFGFRFSCAPCIALLPHLPLTHLQLLHDPALFYPKPSYYAPIKAVLSLVTSVRCEYLCSLESHNQDGAHPKKEWPFGATSTRTAIGIVAGWSARPPRMQRIPPT